jgi:hypothetical protein
MRHEFSQWRWAKEDHTTFALICCPFPVKVDNIFGISHSIDKLLTESLGVESGESPRIVHLV